MKTQQEVLKELVESLGQAAGACSQLIHQQQNPNFIVIRQAVELMKEGVLGLATFEAKKITPIKPK